MEYKYGNSKCFQEKIRKNTSELSEIFEKQEHLAKAKQELYTLQLEIKYFEQYCAETGSGEDMLKARRNQGLRGRV